MISAYLRRIWSPDWIPILLAQGIGVSCGVLGVHFISAWVPPDVLGLYGLALALVPAGAILTHHGLARHAARHWPLAGGAGAYQEILLTTARKASLVLAALLALGLAVVSAVSELPYLRSLPWLWIAGITGAYGAIFHAILQTSRSYWKDCLVSCGTSLTRTGGPLLAVLVAGATAPLLLAGFALPQALLMVAAWYWIIGRRHPRTAAESAAVQIPAPGELGTYGRSFWVVGACMLICGALHRLWAAVCLDATELGFFTLAGNLAFVLPNVISGAISQFLTPRVFAQARRDGDRASRGWLRTVEWTIVGFLAIALAATLVLQLAGPWLLGVLIDPAYTGAVPYLFANGAYASALAVGHFYQLPAVAASRPGAASRSMIGMTLILAAGGGITALVFPAWYATWLSFSPLTVMLWLSFAARARFSH